MVCLGAEGEAMSAQLALTLTPRAAVKQERERAASKHAAEIARLVPIALQLARAAGPSGITADDVRITAENRGLLTGHEPGRSLSYLSAVPIAARLAKTNRRRLSRSRNDQVVWVLHAFSHDGAA